MELASGGPYFILSLLILAVRLAFTEGGEVQVCGRIYSCPCPIAESEVVDCASFSTLADIDISWHCPQETRIAIYLQNDSNTALADATLPINWLSSYCKVSVNAYRSTKVQWRPIYYYYSSYNNHWWYATFNLVYRYKMYNHLLSIANNAIMVKT